MADGDEKLWAWKAEFGWNHVFGGITTAVLVGTIILSFGSVRNAADNSTAAVVELKTITSELRKASEIAAERITKVEVQIDSLSKSMDRIERKVDQIPTNNKPR